LTYSIVRPSAFFKSLSGQVKRVKNGKPFLMFGDDELTACKPISDDDLGEYIAGCLNDTSRHNRILPIGGPRTRHHATPAGRASVCAALGEPPRCKHVPVRLLDVIIGVLTSAGHVLPSPKDKAELARIGRYYATESILVLDLVTGSYDADGTSSTGTETLFDHHDGLVAGTVVAERGDHAVF
jgi:divinyl chlorophyllide a 8-vinyl-reductase